MFHNFISGNAGEQMIGQYIELLVQFSSLVGEPGLAKDCFQMALQQIGEVWRRFYHEYQRFPFKMFRLAETPKADFMREYRLLQKEGESCGKCVDLEFSAVLLTYIPATEADDSAVTQLKVTHLQEFLKDVAVFSPLSTCLVECLHGALQSRLHRFRGVKPTDAIAKEITTLDKVTSAYGRFKDYMWGRLGDRRAFNRLHAYNQHKGNQYASSKGGSPEDDSQEGCRRGLTTNDLDRMLESGLMPSAPRKLCGAPFRSRQLSSQVKMVSSRVMSRLVQSMFTCYHLKLQLYDCQYSGFIFYGQTVSL